MSKNGSAAHVLPEDFDPETYLALNEDVAAAGIDPATHYLEFGKTEGRWYFRPEDRLPEGFDPALYLELNPDLAAAGVDPVAHYLSFGAGEGREFLPPDGRLAFLDYLGRFTDLAPSPQNGFSLFEGGWSTRIPEIEGTGSFAGLRDPRIRWLLEEVGDLSGASVLELGPLEGGHSYMLEQAGAEVTAIEANYGAFLRCLVVKNHFGMRARFLLGDFQHETFQPASHDLVVASGVLYHMMDPVGLLTKLGKVARRLFLWTHYFEEDLSLWAPEIRAVLEQGKWETDKVVAQEVDGLRVRMVRQFYGESLGWEGFCGGSGEASLWIYREDLIALLRQLGYSDIRIAFDMPDHQNGPSFAILAQKE